jgi:hypothetical protein
MKSTSVLVLATAVAVAFTDCAPRPGAMTASGLEELAYGYAIRFKDGASFAGAQWLLDNYATDARGRYAPKTGATYVGTRELDVDGDGDSERFEEPLYDLRLANVSDGAVIWTKAHPLLPRDAGKTLDILLSNYADSIAVAGAYADLNAFSQPPSPMRRFTSFVVEQKPRLVAGHPALSALVELAEVDKLRVNPDHRHSKLRLVLVKYGHLQTSSSAPSTPWPSSKQGQNWVVERTALLVLGYVNTAARFERHTETFSDFVSLVRFANYAYFLDPKRSLPEELLSGATATNDASAPALDAQPSVQPRADAAAAPAADPASLPGDAAAGD